MMTYFGRFSMFVPGTYRKTKRWATLKIILSGANKTVQGILRMALHLVQRIKIKTILSPLLITLGFRRTGSVILIWASQIFFEIMKN